VIRVTTSITIARPISDVFAYVSEPRNLPAWNSAVEEVRPLSLGGPVVGSVYAMQRQLPSGPTVNRLEIVIRHPPSEFAMRTTSGPTPFLYRYRFVADDTATVIEFGGDVDLPSVGGIAAQFVRRGVDHNLATLKRILEAATLDGLGAA
jgi:hypothetical protein